MRDALCGIATCAFSVLGLLGVDHRRVTATLIAAAPIVKPVPKPAAKLKPLIPVSTPPTLGLDLQLFGTGQQSGDRKTLVAAIDHSLRYLRTQKAIADYGKLSTTIPIDRVQRSLKRFRSLLITSRSPTELKMAVQREFAFYQATGKDGKGTVGFTGYFEPVHAASRTATSEFRYPIFRLPSTFSRWSKPHPNRAALEGDDGLQFAKGSLKGLEIAWLRDRLQAFLIQVQGSARLNLTDGSTLTVGYAGSTDYPYTGVGRELVKAGKFKLEELTLPALTQYFQKNPAEMNIYLPRNQRFVFFKETQGSPAMGSIGVPVLPERSIATDKTLFPPGALAIIQTQMPYPATGGKLAQQQVTRYVLDQDTGSAIKGAGRVDVFVGTGVLAGDRAGLINSSGQLYYLLLKQ
ncbi:MltA domain-containing protein [Phormidium sp. CLA17]|nr:MltA domain-containing protein [Leptolyngbya sp. Cla-17]